MHQTGELAPPVVYLDEPTPIVHITVVDGNVYLFAFSLADFLEIQLKFTLY